MASFFKVRMASSSSYYTHNTRIQWDQSTSCSLSVSFIFGCRPACPLNVHGIAGPPALSHLFFKKKVHIPFFVPPSCWGHCRIRVHSGFMSSLWMCSCRCNSPKTCGFLRAQLVAWSWRMYKIRRKNVRNNNNNRGDEREWESEILTFLGWQERAWSRAGKEKPCRLWRHLQSSGPQPQVWEVGRAGETFKRTWL